MRFKPTLILLFVAAVTLGYFFLVEQPGHKEKVAQEESATKLFDLTGMEVFGLVIRRDDATLTFTRSGDAWRMITPSSDRAEMPQIMVLVLSVLRSKAERQFPADPTRLAEYGLANPVATVSLRDSLQAELLTLDVGDFNLTKSHCYAREDGSDTVMLVHAGVRRYALTSVFEYRDKKVVEFPIEDVSALEITSDLHRTSWSKSVDERWFTVVGGDTIRGDDDEMDTILRELRAMRAQDVKDGDPAAWGLSDPAGSIVVRLPDADAIGLSFAGPDSQRCYIQVKGEERINMVDASALDVFGRSLHDLRDRRLLHFDRDVLRKVTLNTKTLSISIIKMGENWSFANPSFDEIDIALVSAFLGSLKAMKYREIIEETMRAPEEYGLDHPAYRLALFDAEGDLIDEVVTGPTRTIRRTRYATSRSSGHLGVVDAEPFEEMEGLFEEFQLQ